MATLYLLRHAKSAWDDPALKDHDRPLAPRGERATALIGAYLRQHDVCPDLVVCSSAVRARATWDRVAAWLDCAPAPAVEPELYLCGAKRLLDRLRRIAPGTGSALLVAHNPDLQDLALTLVGEGRKQDIARLARKYPTGGLAVLTLTVRGWADLGRGAARLDRFVTPKQLV